MKQTMTPTTVSTVIAPAITCPNCRTEIKLTESLAAPLIESTRLQYEAQLSQNGWKWQGDDRIKRVLCHPDDPEIYIWLNPYTGEKLLSPSLVERLKQTVHVERKDLPEA